MKKAQSSPRLCRWARRVNSCPCGDGTDESHGNVATDRPDRVHPAAPTNGLAERFIRTLEENLLWVHHFATVAELIEALREFRRRYNEQWLMECHGFRTPSQVRPELTGGARAVA